MAKQRQADRETMPGKSGETRSADAFTVAWVMLTLTTLLCELGFAGAAAVSRGIVAPRIELLSQLLFFAALVSGVTGLILLPFVLRMRSQPPPQVILVVAMVIYLIPIVLLFV